MEIRLEEGEGSLTCLTDSTARLCFTPADVDSATYMFVVCVADPVLSMEDEVAPLPGRFVSKTPYR